MADNKQFIIDGLMHDVVGIPAESSKEYQKATKEEIQDTITKIFKQYNLSTNNSFVTKVAQIKWDDKTQTIDMDSIPQQLQDAAFLPVNTIADIALRQDLDLVISQIPEWFTALQITRDAICESDVVTGRMARNITFDRTNMKEPEIESIMEKINEVEERLDLDSIIKNHCIFNTLQYGEGYLYLVPYAKVFQDLYKFKSNASKKKLNKTSGNTMTNMFQMSTNTNGYGYSETFEISLKDAIINEHRVDGTKSDTVFTESEIMDVFPWYHDKQYDNQKEMSDKIDDEIAMMAENITYVEQDIALPVIDEEPYEIEEAYKAHMRKANVEAPFVQETDLFTEVNTGDDNGDGILNEFQNVKGIYMRILPSTKLIPIRIDREVIGYYYIADMTKAEQAGERKNSGLSGYTLRSPSVGYDTFAPDQMLCEKLATKIINNFNLKFMRNNTSLHKQIVSILMAHKFNEAMLRFVFIPAEHVIQFTINKDGMNKGHSMLEPGLVTARMYMFLKLYSLLFQINNSAVRVYYLHMSGIDNDYRQFVQQTIRKFAARRITANDIFNYRSSMYKVSGGSELIMPMGAGDKAPITFDTIQPSEAPISNELLEQLKNESINSTPVPSLMVQTGGQSEIEFAKETELANTRFNTMISSYKIDINKDATKLYRVIMKWETDIPDDVIATMRYVLRMPMAKQLNVTTEMIQNFESVADMSVKTFLTPDEAKPPQNSEGYSDTVREFRKLMLADMIPQLDIDHYEELANKARENAGKLKLANSNPAENLLDQNEEEM